MTGAMLLRPGLRVLARGHDEVQIGLDPRWAVRLVGLGPALVRLWESVDDETDLACLAARASAAGTDPDAVSATVGALHAAGLTRPAPRRDTVVRGPTAADATAWGLLSDDRPGDDVVGARADAVVGVVGLGPTGLGVARHLAVAGVGCLLLDDDAPVRSPDVAAAAHRWADMGVPRALAAARLLREAAPGTRIGSGETPDVVVVVEHEVADPVRALVLVADEVPHLSVVVRAADATVGPLVRPGTDACLRCLDLHRTDVDPAWPAVRRAAGARPDAGEVGVLAGACASLAAAQVLTLLAGATPRLCGATVELALPDLVASERRWQPHVGCGCLVPPTGTGPCEV